MHNNTMWAVLECRWNLKSIEINIAIAKIQKNLVKKKIKIKYIYYFLNYYHLSIEMFKELLHTSTIKNVK